MEAMQSKEAPGTLHATPSLNLYQLVAARCMNRLCTVSETAGACPSPKWKIAQSQSCASGIRASRVMLEMAKAKTSKTHVTTPRQSTTWRCRNSWSLLRTGFRDKYDKCNMMNSWWNLLQLLEGWWFLRASKHTWRRNPTLHPNESNQLSSQSTLADIYTCCMYWSSSDQSTACMNACEHKTLNSHNWMEMLAMSATMMAYLRAVNDSETLPDLTRLGPANLKKIVHRVICGEGCWRKSYEVSWRRFFCGIGVRTSL